MTVNARDVESFLDDLTLLRKRLSNVEFAEQTANGTLQVGFHLSPFSGLPTSQEMRDREHTKMFLTEIQLRYPGMSLTEIRRRYPGVFARDFVMASVSAINEHSTITAKIVREMITMQEALRGLASTTPPVPPPATPVDAFLTLLADRRGAYTWIPGPSETFTEWVNDPSALDHPLPVTARINCWEAVLAAAAEAGLVSIEVLRGSYLSDDGQRTADHLFDVFVREGTKEVNHPAPGENDVDAGDVILIPCDKPMHHVVAVVTPNREQYRRIQVMSLWSGVSGGIFGLVELADVLPHIPETSTTLRYCSLKELARQD
ncbi:hypothetical protein AB0F17_63255 [Nonomuraea sp. NPDC026600]|uniref:hypothetical protein n=1 Tax=Nonomuraea sp. NPDC026600 TaxID=3155363 RepID=UPI0033DF33B1